MTDRTQSENDMNLSERALMLFEKLREVDTLDAMISLTCSVLDASLYICDHQGQILAHGACSDVRCEFWTGIIASGQVEKKILNSMKSPRPYNNTMKEEQCGNHHCTRLIFPLEIGHALHRYILCIFFWDHTMTYEDQCLASILAGAFASLMQKETLSDKTLEERRVRLLKELLGYKAGLRPYFVSSVRQLELHSLVPPYRLACVRLRQGEKSDAQRLLQALSKHMDRAWCFEHNGWLVAVFREELLPARLAGELLTAYLEETSLVGCVSLAFFDWLKLRGIFEDCCAALGIASRKEPRVRLHWAEHYPCMTFLNRCQQYFSLQDCYPECLTRLMEYDRETGRSYLTTLTAYLENNMNANAAAKQIFMHRNTMTMQLEKIEQIMGVSLANKEMCLYLQICIRMHELLSLS